MRTQQAEGRTTRRVLTALILVATMPACAAGPGASATGAASEPAITASKPLQDDALLAGSERFEQGAKEVTEVNLDKSMLAMAARFVGNDDVEAKRLMAKMDFVYVRSYEFAKAGQYRIEDVAQFRSRMDESKWSHIIKNRSATESTDIWIRTDDQSQFSELMVIAAEPTELTFVHLKGRMSMEELTKAGASYGVPQSGGPKGQKGGK